MTRFGKRMVTLAALALGLSLGGASARADLTLTVSSATGITLAIDSSAGTANLTGGPLSATVVYEIDGQVVTFNTNGSGAASGTFTGNATVVSLEADGLSGLSTFDGYKISSISVTQTAVPLGLTDITTDVSGTAVGVTAPTLTITPGTLLSPGTGPVTVTSDLSATALGSGTVTFISTVNGTNVPTTPLSLSTVGFLPSSAVVNVPTNPVAVSNQIVISGLTGTLTDTINATTTLVAPEPSTIAAAFSGLALVGLASLRRKSRNRA